MTRVKACRSNPIGLVSQWRCYSQRPFKTYDQGSFRFEIKSAYNLQGRLLGIRFLKSFGRF